MHPDLIVYATMATVVLSGIGLMILALRLPPST